MQCNYHSCAGPVFRRYLLASPQRSTLSQGVGEASSQPQHQQVALPQIANLLFLDADVTQLCQIQHNCVSEGEKNIKIQDSAPSICADYRARSGVLLTFLLPLPPQGQDQSVQAKGLEFNQVLGFVKHGLLPFLHVLHGYKQTAGHIEKLPQEAVCDQSDAEKTDGIK